MSNPVLNHIQKMAKLPRIQRWNKRREHMMLCVNSTTLPALLYINACEDHLFLEDLETNNEYRISYSDPTLFKQVADIIGSFQ